MPEPLATDLIPKLATGQLAEIFDARTSPVTLLVRYTSAGPNNMRSYR